MAITLYGISNCDTVRSARNWLTARSADFAFHDYKKAGVDPARITAWIERAGLDRVLNKAGTTFRALPDEAKAGLTATSAAMLMATHPSIIRRPIIEHDGGLLIGFKPEEWQAVF